jgi:non-lysosomal glucosylceramidase
MRSPERRPFVVAALVGLIAAVAPALADADSWRADWPVLKTYDRDHVEKIALPVGGIGTGTVSLGGRGNLMDWEIMNRPAKGYTPYAGQQTGPFFAIHVEDGSSSFTRVLEGPLPLSAYEASHGSTAVNHGLPRFRNVSFAAAYPLGQVFLSDQDAPVDVRLEAWNPLVPGDADDSGWPVAALRIVVINKTGRPLRAAVCGTLPNFIGADGSGTAKDWKGDPMTTGPVKNRNEFRATDKLRGIFMSSAGVAPRHEAWGTIALAAPAGTRGTSRTAWVAAGWGTPLLDFWDDFSADGKVDPRPATTEDMPFASLTVEVDVPAGGSAEAPFLLAWHFPNRVTWSPQGTPDDVIGNYYTTRWPDAWAAAEDFASRAAALESRTAEFVRAFASTTLPAEVKEAALFNLSTLRTQTCFRTRDGRFFGFEGSSNNSGCCWGSCTHVWNYEQATGFLFGALARSMRETEFLEATDGQGLMSFRVRLPIARAREFGKAAADGQMGTIMRVFRDWKMSGDGAWLARLWPSIKRALSFAWIKGGWDADRDGVMEGCQHNTMDVEYYGPNPQMELWYLGALRACEEMAGGAGDTAFARLCADLFARGRAWTDANLWNGEYYEHHVQPPKSVEDVAPALRLDMGAKSVTEPDYQLAQGCLVDQLVGQSMARVCGLGDLVDPAHAKTTLQSILKYNTQAGFYDHFNCLRSFVLGDETALLMASYPKGRPRNPFPYFTEVMTGFEYTAAVGLLYEGDVADGLKVIADIRARYDGRKRSPFDEAECGHHYARAMASWAAVPALSGFSWDGRDGSMAFTDAEGTWFWSNGDAWGTCRVGAGGKTAELKILHGGLLLRSFRLGSGPVRTFKQPRVLKAGESLGLEF